MELTFELAEKLLAAQPFSVLVGARVTAFGDGGATLELDIREDLQQQNGFLHGGVLAYAADNAITFAAGSALGPEVLTGRLSSISYLRPARGAILRADAKVAHSGRRQATCTCELTTLDDAGTPTLCAIARARSSPGSSVEELLEERLLLLARCAGSRTAGRTRSLSYRGRRLPLLLVPLLLLVARLRRRRVVLQLGIHQPLQLTPIEKDPPALSALVDSDAVALVRPHPATTLRTRQALHPATLSDDFRPSRPTLSELSEHNSPLPVT